MATKKRTDDQEVETLRTIAVEIGGSTALGPAKVRLEFEPRLTVLVGRNAAGKSAMLEETFAALREPNLRTHRRGPRSFVGEFQRADKRRLNFQYSWKPMAVTDESVDLDVTRGLPVEWTERCYYVDGGKSEPIWELSAGKLNVADVAGELPFPQGESLLSLSSPSLQSEELALLSFATTNIRRVRAGVPREDAHRQHLFFRQRTTDGQAGWLPVGPRNSRLSNVIIGLLRWSESGSTQFEEFRELCMKLKLCKEMNVAKFSTRAQVADAEPLAEITFDGINSGLLSDGTLRAVETLYSILAIRPGGVLFLEEPETGIHPGLLNSILNVVDAYSTDRQIVLSTHSPIVVSRAKPEELRLVERSKDATKIRKLSANESVLIGDYLNDDGNLGEFVFDGGLDDA